MAAPAMSTAGRYVGAYRVPATEDVKDVLDKVKDGKYYDQVGACISINRVHRNHSYHRIFHVFSTPFYH